MDFKALKDARFLASSVGAEELESLKITSNELGTMKLLKLLIKHTRPLVFYKQFEVVLTCAKGESAYN